MRGTEIDNYLAANFYGKQRFKNIHDETIGEQTIIENLDLNETFTHQVRLMQRNSMKGQKTSDKEEPKMTAFQTFVSIIKAYCCLMILVLPRSFARGGYLLSPLAMVMSASLQCYSAVKLVGVANHFGIMSYSLIAYKVFGTKGKIALDIMVALTQFTFAISFMSFICQAWKESALGLWGGDYSYLSIALVMVAICVPISWVRDITKFSFTFLFGNLMILANLIVITVYMVNRADEKGLGDGL